MTGHDGVEQKFRHRVDVMKNQDFVLFRLLVDILVLVPSPSEGQSDDLLAGVAAPTGFGGAEQEDWGGGAEYVVVVHEL